MLPRKPSSPARSSRAAQRSAPAAMLLGSLAALCSGACAPGDYFVDEPRASLSFITTDGETEAEINGTWRGPCLAETAGSSRIVLDFIDADHALILLGWETASACAGDPDTVAKHEGTLTIDGIKAVGWVPAAPNVLPATITATRFTHTLKEAADFGAGATGLLHGVGIVVATASPEFLYLGGGFDIDLAVGSDGYPEAMQADAFLKD